MSQWTYRSGSFVSAGNVAGDALSIAKPIGLTTGDLIVYVAYWETDANTITASNSLASAQRHTNTGAFMLEVFLKIATGGEPANYTFTPNTNGQWRAAIGACYSGGTGTGTLVDITGVNQGDAAIDASQTAPSVTTTGVNRLVIYAGGNVNGNTHTNMNASGAANTFRGAIPGMVLGDGAKAAAGATGTSNPTGGGSSDFAAIHVAVISDSGGGGTDLSVGIGSLGEPVVGGSTF